MRKTIKKYFIPHQGNNYHPHILHAKRAIFYGGLFLAMKMIVVGLVLLLPLEAFVTPDILADQQRQIIALTNQVRAQHGLPKLAEKSPLDRSSDAKAGDMAAHEYFAHAGPHNRTLAYFLDQAGYHYLSAGENLAMGFADAREVVNAWIKSPTHYANLIDPEFADLGVGLESGYYQGVPTVYVAQHLGLPDLAANYPVVDSAATVVVQTSTIRDIVSSTQQVAGINIQAATATARTTSAATVIKLGGPTPVEKYLRAESSRGIFSDLFEVSKNIYLAFILFFSLALLLKIFIEIKKQRPHVILQTLGLLGLLICFYLL